MQHVRLLNTAQVIFSTTGAEHEYRPNCVEITVDKERQTSTIVMLTIQGHEDAEIDPILIGRISLPVAVSVEDPMDGDGVSWLVSSAAMLMVIRPYKDEAIFLDPSFGQDLPDDLRKLYDILRASRNALVVHSRLLTSTPESYPEIIANHKMACDAIQGTITKLETKIAAREAERDQRRAAERDADSRRS